MSAAAWYGQVKAAHTRALASPQVFALTGDGREVFRLASAPVRDSELIGAKLADARYRDWLANNRNTGEAVPTARLPAANLELTADDDGTGNGTGNGSSRMTAAEQRKRDQLLTMAQLIIRELTEEFGDLFPDEFTQAKAFLAEEC